MIDFIIKAKAKHQDKYDYSLVDYKNNKIKIKIICQKHGIFEQVPKSHTSGNGCPKCANNAKLGSDKFIIEANIIHSNKYDYSLVKDYKNSYSYVSIICPKHGIFDQMVGSHLHSKNGCPDCADNIRLTTDKFITRAKEIHGNKYDYSLVDYKTNKTKVKIICPNHGIYLQIPNSHLSSKTGCPICKESKGEKEITFFLASRNIRFDKQKTFENCKNINKLPFDFYLQDLNICIEYDGEQHFVAKDVWGGEETLKYIQKNDIIKNKYCKDYNIKLIRISYKENVSAALIFLTNRDF